MEWLNDQLAGICDFTIASKLCDDLYSGNLLIAIMVICFFISLIMAFIYYKIIDSPSFQRWYHWLMVLAVNFAVNFIVGFAIPQQKLADLGYYIVDFSASGIGNALFSCLFFMLGSLLIKPFSKNCKTTPF